MTTTITTPPRSNYGNVLRSLTRTFPNLSPDELSQLAKDLDRAGSLTERLRRHKAERG
jgi:hypothetical protein